MSRVLVEHRPGGVTLVTLNRPEALNALDTELLLGLRSAFSGLDAKAVVLTGAGRAFCTGADLKARATMDIGEWRAHHELVRETFAAVRDCPAPTVAAIEGFALAGGFELAIGCDLIVAAEDARFGLPETTRGIMPGSRRNEAAAPDRGDGPSEGSDLDRPVDRCDDGCELGLVARTAAERRRNRRRPRARHGDRRQCAARRPSGETLARRRGRARRLLELRPERRPA